MKTKVKTLPYEQVLALPRPKRPGGPPGCWERLSG